MLVDPEELELAQPFSDIFPERSDVVQAIEAKMAATGYDMAQPIVIWQREPGTKPVVVDGNQRCRAARKAKIDVGVFFQSFASEDEAVDYAISRQRDRRNLTDLELRKCVELLDKRKTPGGDGEERTKEGGRGGKKSSASNAALDSGPGTKPNRSAADTAKKCGVSTAKVERTRYINTHAPDQYKQNMEAAPAGESKPWTLNKCWRETQKLVAEKKTAAKRDAMAAPAVGRSTTAPPEIKRAVASIPLPKSGLPVTDAEREFMSRIPLRVELAEGLPVSTMDNDLRIFLMLEPTLKRIKEDVLKLLGPCSKDWLAPLHKAVAELVDTPHPSSWRRCQKCDGEKVRLGDGTCKRCRGCGYSIN